MYKTIIKKTVSIFLFLTFSTITPSEKQWHTILGSPYPIQWCIAGAATAIIIGKLSYNYYQTHQISPKKVIEDCQSLHTCIYQDVEQYYNFYHSDAQISDWDLKEIILDNNKKTYPFLRYYTDLTKASLILDNHRIALSKQLADIDCYKKQSTYIKNNRLKQTILQLETEGKYLLEQTAKIISLLIILKHRVKLFKEYTNDCYCWSQKNQNKNTGKP
jgi:hypothetical protein